MSEICVHCGQPIEMKERDRGLHNWKNLFRKPSMSDWITLFIILMVLVGAYAYNIETKQCRETLSNLDSVCMKYNTPTPTGPGQLSVDNVTMAIQSLNLSESVIKNEGNISGRGS